MILAALITGFLCALSFLLGYRYGGHRCNRVVVPIWEQVMLETSDKWEAVCRETNAQWEQLHRNGSVVYIDELQRWPTKSRCFKPGSCHLTADTLEELHAFAAKLGLKREWFQDHLTPRKRLAAKMFGATFVPIREQLAKRRRA